MSAMERGRILIVDDIRTNVKFLVQSLKSDYEIFIADNGPRALELAALELPDLVLLDIMMPEMDGYEVCRRLKADERTQNISILFMTAKDGDHDEAKCFEQGAVDFITKPYNNTVVRARVKNHLELKRYRDFLALARKNSASGRDDSATMSARGETFNLNQILTSLLLENGPMEATHASSKSVKGMELPDIPGVAFLDGLKQWGDLEIYKKAIAHFIRDHSADGMAIRSAVLAGNRDKALAMAHALKGGAGTIRATDLAKAAAALELGLKKNETVLEPLLLALDTSLLVLVNSGKLLTVEKAPSHQRRSLVPLTEQLSALVKRIAFALDHGDTLSAEGDLPELLAWFRGTELEDDFETLTHQVEEIDSRAAKETLIRIVHSLEVK